MRAEELTAYRTEILLEARRPDGVLPPGWMIVQPDAASRQHRRFSQWMPPPPYDASAETMNLIFATIIAVLIALAIGITVSP